MSIIPRGLYTSAFEDKTFVQQKPPFVAIPVVHSPTEQLLLGSMILDCHLGIHIPCFNQSCFFLARLEPSISVYILLLFIVYTPIWRDISCMNIQFFFFFLISISGVCLFRYGQHGRRGVRCLGMEKPGRIRNNLFRCLSDGLIHFPGIWNGMNGRINGFST